MTVDFRYKQVKSKIEKHDAESEREPENKKIIQEFNSKKEWYDYLSFQLNNLLKIAKEHEWIPKMIKHLK